MKNKNGWLIAKEKSFYGKLKEETWYKCRKHLNVSSK